MKQLHDYRPHEPNYAAAFLWAQLMYMSTIRVKPPKRPDTLLAISQDEHFYGCIGLNQDVSCALFMSDPRCQMLIQQRGANYCCEQSILIAPRYPRALPLLIGAAAFQAYLNGKTTVLFAGIATSIKTIKALGLEIEDVGQVTLDHLDDATRQNYQTWFQSYGNETPRFCALDTTDAPAAFDYIVKHYASGRVEIKTPKQVNWVSAAIAAE